MQPATLMTPPLDRKIMELVMRSSLVDPKCAVEHPRQIERSLVGRTGAMHGVRILKNEVDDR